ncbi:recombinase family protein [Spirosoma sp. KCTC 42546]
MLQAPDCEKVYQEKFSGACKERPQPEEPLKSLRPGDEVVVWKLNRLGLG